MRFYYVDPGLLNDIGHHANSCRFISQALRTRGIPTSIFSHRDIEASLGDELGTIPHFRIFPYWRSDDDPICGWLNAFDATTHITTNDLAYLPPTSVDDIVFLNSAQPAQLMAISEWQSSLQPDAAPTIFVEFAVPPGVSVQQGNEGLEIGLPDLQSDRQAFLYRFAARRLARHKPPRLHLVTYDSTCSSIFSALLDVDVEVLPWPHYALSTPRTRVGKRPITISVLGHQRTDKGYQHMPEVIETLLKTDLDITILAHNAVPEAMPDTQQCIRRLAEQDPRVKLDERAADKTIWHELLEASDLIVCPYNFARYSSSHSTVISEAISYGIPTVVPANTVPAQIVSEYGGGGVTFAEESPAAISDSIIRAIGNYDGVAARAFTASAEWARRNGPGPIIDAILQLAGESVHVAGRDVP